LSLHRYQDTIPSHGLVP